MKKGGTYLRIPIAPGDNIIGNGLSRGYFSHRLTKARKIRPCATCTLIQLVEIDNLSPHKCGSYQDDLNRLLPVHIWRLNLANLRNQAV